MFLISFVDILTEMAAYIETEMNIVEDIKKELGVNVSLGHAKDTNTYQLQISGRHQVERILNYLYKGSEEETRLNRKYQKYLDCLEWVHRH